jgi:gamma-glutamyltranspeptidase / glutathione hydrolase
MKRSFRSGGPRPAFPFFWMPAVLMILAPLAAGDRLTGRVDASRSEVIARHGMVATSQPLAVQIGVEILKRGGSAVDAAIAVNAALGLMEPTGSGLGGDLFALVWDNRSAKLFGLNASGPAPRSITLGELRRRGLTRMPQLGPLPWTVPGCVAGWGELHKRFGRLKLSEVLEPAIRYAEEGFPLSELIAAGWGRSCESLAKTKEPQYRNFLDLYAPGGKIPQKGDIFRNPRLASTLRKIAAGGPDRFYRGEIAQQIVAYSKKVGGFFSIDDFASYHAEWVEPITVRYRGHDVWQLPPNGQGLAVLQMLKMLERFDLHAMGHNSADFLHTFIEVKKIVYEDRARLYADPRFFRTPVERLISDAYTAERLKLLDPAHASRTIPPGVPENPDTVYLTVVDNDGNAVSLIQSNYFGFGSGMCPDGLGFTLQDRGCSFSLQEGHANALAGGKRPFHTIIPGFVTRGGKPEFSFGVMGGDIQPQGQVQVLLNIIDFGMNVQEAGDAPRVRHSGSSEPDGSVMEDGGTVWVESGIPAGTVRELLHRGHRVSRSDGEFGGYQGIWIDTTRGILLGASESRKDGCAMGY